MRPVRGRFAPSPTGPLHLGNLRTALVAWLMARRSAVASSSSAWRTSIGSPRRPLTKRPSSPRCAASGSIGTARSVRQSERFDLYRAAIERLRSAGLVYECYCTRSEIRQAAAAPQGTDAEGAYPGTCRHLTEQQRRTMRDVRTACRRCGCAATAAPCRSTISSPAHAAAASTTSCCSATTACPRTTWPSWSTMPTQGVTEVVRGDDLLATTPRQIELHRLLGLRTARATRTCRWCSAPTAHGWPSATVR